MVCVSAAPRVAAAAAPTPLSPRARPSPPGFNTCLVPPSPPMAPRTRRISPRISALPFTSDRSKIKKDLPGRAVTARRSWHRARARRPRAPHASRLRTPHGAGAASTCAPPRAVRRRANGGLLTMSTCQLDMLAFPSGPLHVSNLNQKRGGGGARVRAREVCVEDLEEALGRLHVHPVPGVLPRRTSSEDNRSAGRSKLRPKARGKCEQPRRRPVPSRKQQLRGVFQRRTRRCHERIFPLRDSTPP